MASAVGKRVRLSLFGGLAGYNLTRGLLLFAGLFSSKFGGIGTVAMRWCVRLFEGKWTPVFRVNFEIDEEARRRGIEVCVI